MINSNILLSLDEMSHEKDGLNLFMLLLNVLRAIDKNVSNRKITISAFVEEQQIPPTGYVTKESNIAKVILYAYDFMKSGYVTDNNLQIDASDPKHGQAIAIQAIEKLSHLENIEDELLREEIKLTIEILTRKVIEVDRKADEALKRQQNRSFGLRLES